MAKLDNVKADLGFSEKLFFGAMAIMVGVISWTQTGYVDAQRWQLVIAFVAICSVAVYNIQIYRKIKRLTKELEDV